LDHRQDRRDIMKTFFEKGKIPQDKIVRFPAIKHAIPTKGIQASHTSVLALAKQNKWKNILILEDDLQWLDFEPAYKQLCELVLKPDWNVIMLCGWYIDYRNPRVYNARNAGAYLVNEFYIDTLLQNRLHFLQKYQKYFYMKPKDEWNADVGWVHLMQKDVWYAIYPCICSQVDGLSDNSGTNIKASEIVGIYDSKIHEKVFGKR
jgi:glycosyl transferase family 25